MDQAGVDQQRRRGGILKASSKAEGNVDAASNSSVRSTSTQASVYAPIFNPSTRPTSDWYDSINDSDTSTGGHNGRLRLNLGGVKPMPRIAEPSNGTLLASTLVPTPASNNLTPGDPNFPSNLTLNLVPILGGPNLNPTSTPTNVAPLLDPTLPPQFANLSTNSTPNLGANLTLNPSCNTNVAPILATELPPQVANLSTNLTPHLDANLSKPRSERWIDPTHPRRGSLGGSQASNEDSISIQGYFSDASSTKSSMPNHLRPRVYSVNSGASTLEPSIIYKAAPKPHNENILVGLPFKERNFNFDFENVSLTSTMGVQAFEDLYGVPSTPVEDYRVSPPYSTDGPLQNGEHSTIPSKAPTPRLACHVGPPTINEGYIIDSRRTLSKSGDFGEAFKDDSNSVSLSSKPRSLRLSSVSSSSRTFKTPLENVQKLSVSSQHPSEQSTDISIEDVSSEGGEERLASFDKVVKMGAKGTFLLCIPKGICMPEGSLKSNGSRSMDDSDSMPIQDCVRGLWADVYHPTSFDAFLCHVQQAQLLRQLISQGNCPHIFFHGLSSYGKKLIMMTLLRELFGPSAWKVSQEEREFKTKGEKKVSIEVVASKFHVELDAGDLGENAKALLSGLFKETAQSMETSRTISVDEDYQRNFKVIVIYKIDKLSNDTQQLVRWLMDRYGDTCKLLLCSKKANNVLDSVRSRCQIVDVDPPSEQEMGTILQHIAGQEKLMVSLNFIMRIVRESKHNLRHAIESLEACKPLRQGQVVREDLPIPTGWEDVIVELAKGILMEQTPKRMFVARGKLQSLLRRQVPSQLILKSLVAQLLQKLDLQLKKEICHWYRIYEKRLLSTSTSIDKLEEFVAKFMSIYKKHKKTTISEPKRIV